MAKELNIANLVEAWISSSKYSLVIKTSLEHINYLKSADQEVCLPVVP